MIQNQNITAQSTDDSSNHHSQYFGLFDFNVMEIWKDVPNYEGFYKVSNLGRVKSLSRNVKCGYNSTRRIKGRVLGQRIRECGYYIVDLCHSHHILTIRVHTLVAMAFFGHNSDGLHYTVIDHIDYNKLNNHLSNLQIITNRENCSKDKFRNNPSSKYVGVSLIKKTGKWMAQIMINKKSINLGHFDAEIDASNAYQDRLKTL